MESNRTARDHSGSGHTLVHYLFTDTYQCLAPKAWFPHAKVAAGLTTSIRVCALAREYELFSLEELAKLENERLGNGLSFSIILGLVRDVYPDPSADDTWCSSYLKPSLDVLLQNPCELSDCVTPNAERKALSVSDLLFENLVELVHNHDILPLALSVASPVEVLEGSAFVMPAPELGPAEEAAPGLDNSDISNRCEPDLEPKKKEDDDVCGFYISEISNTKGKMKASPTVELEPESKLVQERELDPEPEESQEEDIWGRPVSKETKDKKWKKKKKKLQTLKSELLEAASAATDDWSLCESDGKETNLKAKELEIRVLGTDN